MIPRFTNVLTVYDLYYMFKLFLLHCGIIHPRYRLQYYD
jgi:hypothetical protein